jgi:hypothetical protein
MFVFLSFLVIKGYLAPTAPFLCDAPAEFCAPRPPLFRFCGRPAANLQYFASFQNESFKNKEINRANFAKTDIFAFSFVF